jgi:hypothetical protein
LGWCFCSLRAVRGGQSSLRLRSHHPVRVLSLASSRGRSSSAPWGSAPTPTRTRTSAVTLAFAPNVRTLRLPPVSSTRSPFPIADCVAHSIRPAIVSPPQRPTGARMPGGRDARCLAVPAVVRLGPRIAGNAPIKPTRLACIAARAARARATGAAVPQGRSARPTHSRGLAPRNRHARATRPRAMRAQRAGPMWHRSSTCAAEPPRLAPRSAFRKRSLSTCRLKAAASTRAPMAARSTTLWADTPTTSRATRR